MLRESLLTVLDKWEQGELDARQVHEAAERLSASNPPTSEGAKEQAIEFEVLSQLEILNHQLITPADIPAIRAFLASPNTAQQEAWGEWKRYWDHLDYEQRRKDTEHNTYYTARRFEGEG